MSYIWSATTKFTTWRRLWWALAKAEAELGIEISDEQVEELEQNVNNIDWELAAQKESEFRHDVMGHVHAHAEVCPLAAPIIHLGATSCFVGDNTDVIQMREGLKLILRKLVHLLKSLQEFATSQASLPTLGFTHYQPAQLTTVGKRACLWMQDLWLDCQEVSFFAFRKMI